MEVLDHASEPRQCLSRPAEARARLRDRALVQRPLREVEIALQGGERAGPGAWPIAAGPTLAVTNDRARSSAPARAVSSRPQQYAVSARAYVSVRSTADARPASSAWSRGGGGTLRQPRRRARARRRTA